MRSDYRLLSIAFLRFAYRVDSQTNHGNAMHDSLEIARLALRNGYTDQAAISIAAGESISQFRNRLVLAGAAVSPELGMSRSEIAQYSFGRAINGAREARDGRIGGLEGVVSDELGKRFNIPAAAHRLHIPIDVVRHYAQTRADVVGTLGAGGYLVETQNLGFVGLSLPRMIFSQLGVQTLEGLVGNVNVPTMKTSGGQTDLPSETTQAGEHDQTFGQVSLTPKTEGAYTELSRLLLKQTSPAAQAFISNQILAAFAARLEFLGLQGSGVAGQPLGLLSAATGTVTGTSLALAGVLGFQTQIGDRLDATGGYVTTQAVAALLAARQKASGTSSFLWEGSIFQGVMAGFPSLSTSNMPSAKILFGAWSHALFASWGTLSIEVNPFSNFQAGIVGMRILHDIDFVALDPAAFAVATGVT